MEADLSLSRSTSRFKGGSGRPTRVPFPRTRSFLRPSNTTRGIALEKYYNAATLFVPTRGNISRARVAVNGPVNESGIKAAVTRGRVLFSRGRESQFRVPRKIALPRPRSRVLNYSPAPSGRNFELAIRGEIFSPPSSL